MNNKCIATTDAAAAACILERYIEDHGDGSIAANPHLHPTFINTPRDQVMRFDFQTVRDHLKSVLPSYNRHPPPRANPFS